jgi:ribosomal subunit interface protein
MQPSDDTTDTPRIAIHGQQLDVGDALRAHVTEHLIAVSAKYFGNMQDMTVRFSRTGNGGFACMVRAHAGRDLFFDGTAEAADAHIAFNQALERVAKQLRRRKRALREDKPVNPIKEGLL